MAFIAMFYYTRYQGTTRDLKMAVIENKELTDRVSDLSKDLETNRIATERTMERERKLKNDFNRFKNEVRDAQSKAWRDSTIPEPELNRLRDMWEAKGSDTKYLYSSNIPRAVPESGPARDDR